jgi:hypothetical protein
MHRTMTLLTSCYLYHSSKGIECHCNSSMNTFFLLLKLEHRILKYHSPFAHLQCNQQPASAAGTLENSYPNYSAIPISFTLINLVLGRRVELA